MKIERPDLIAPYHLSWFEKASPYLIVGALISLAVLVLIILNAI